MSVDADLDTVREAMRAFGREASQVTPILTGRVNQHWQVVLPGGGAAVLRRYTASRSNEAVEYEHAALSYAHSKEWPVAAPIKTPGGAEIVYIDGDRFSLFPFLPGSPPPAEGLAQRRIDGRLLARFTGDMARAPLDQQRDGFGRLWELDLFVQSARDESFNGLLRRFGSDYNILATAIRHQRYTNLRELSRLGYGELSSTLIHGDFQRENLRFDAGELTGLLDFDSVRQDAAVTDLAASLWLDCLEPPAHDAIDIRAAAALAEGYAGLRNLSAQETALIPALVRAHMLVFVALRLTEWASGSKRSVASIARTVERRFPALEASSGPLLEALVPIER
jgi:Ser/Thr protein kinase RdoA (MazF antagonist)